MPSPFESFMVNVYLASPSIHRVSIKGLDEAYEPPDSVTFKLLPSHAFHFCNCHETSSPYRSVSNSKRNTTQSTVGATVVGDAVLGIAKGVLEVGLEVVGDPVVGANVVQPP